MALAWLRRAGRAANVVGDRAELWLPGAIAAFAYLGWIPLILAVVPLPHTSDLIFLGTRLASSSIFPLNVVLIAAVMAVVVLLACGAAALGEAAVERGLGEERPSGGLADDAASTYAIVLVVAMPVGMALAALAIGLAGIAPDQVTTPDIGGPLVARVLAALAPFLVVLATIVLFAQAVGAAAMRRATGQRRVRLGAALVAGIGDLLRRPARRLGIAFITMLVDLLALAAAVLLLHTLWAPIGLDLAAGRLASPVTLILLLAFVTVWLTTVLAGGALHAWGTAWWSLELVPAPEDDAA
jgi:hypothetical protein